MANTTNFGWETPDDTDLVKDGALAMRTLGNAIDTSLVDLKGGTSGQILAKNTNTDMDFVWINNDQGDITAVNAGTGISGGGTSGSVTITNTVATTFDAAGDLLVGTGSDTWKRLGIGTAGQILKVNSGANDLEWGTASAGALTLISTTTITGSVASQSINDVFSSTYDDYLIISSLTMATWAGSLGYRLRVSGSDTTTNYRHSRVYLNSGGAGWTNAGNTNAGTAMALADVSGTTDQMRSVIWVLRPNLAAKTYSIAQTEDFDGTNTYMTQSQGIQTDTTQFTGITFLGTNSNISSGTISIYGVSK